MALASCHVLMQVSLLPLQLCPTVCLTACPVQSKHKFDVKAKLSGVLARSPLSLQAWCPGGLAAQAQTQQHRTSRLACGSSNGNNAFQVSGLA